MSIKVNLKFMLELDKKIKESLLKSAEVIKKEAKGQAPVDSGRLKNSIKIDRSDLNSNEVRIGSDLDYALITELGGLTGNGGVRTPRPFLRPALKMSKSRIKRIFKGK